MGFFSWQTADTKKSIMNAHSRKFTGTVYMLQPDGELPIKEEAYEGYGVFGEVDAYEWLARKNIQDGDLAQIDKDSESDPEKIKNALVIIGIELDLGQYFVDTEDRTKGYTIFWSFPFAISGEGVPKNIMHYPVRFDEPLEDFDGKTANDLIESGRFERHDVPTPKFPLKFSFNENAVYEDLPASENCPDQGCF